MLVALLKSKPNIDINKETNNAPPPIPMPALNKATKKPKNINPIFISFPFFAYFL
ncbi:hypothetical protein GMMP15_740016 [Candidatus Magnetomoraceae bacterium gMMP-15]